MQNNYNNSCLSTKFIFSFLLIVIILQVILFGIFHFINVKSEYILKHQTTLKYEIKNIQYHLGEAHLWLHEFTENKTQQTDFIKNSYQKIETSFQNLLALESKMENVSNSNLCNHKFLKENITKLYTQYSQLKETTYQHLSKDSNQSFFKDMTHNQTYNNLIDNINIFLVNIEDTFIKVDKEFQTQKRNFYILIFALILLTTISAFLLIRHNYIKYQEYLHKDQLLEKQTKLADMGQMIDSIAHQWKGPLNIISMRVQMLELDIADKKLSEANVITTIDKVQYQIRHLLETIDEFRKFFKNDSKKTYVSLKELCESCLVLLHDELIRNTIKISIECKKDTSILLNPNEMKHVLINLILNAKDAFLSNQIEAENRRITLIIDTSKNNNTLTVEDTAGGISKEIITKIFDPRFTTKTTMGGTGIGLYLSKQIIEKHGAKIDVESFDQHTKFIIRFQKNEE